MPDEVDLRTLLVLGLIAEEPRHAYDVEQCIRERHLRAWTAIGFSSVYTLLSRLEEQGLAASDEADGEPGRPRRRVYRPTDEGRARLAAWTSNLLRTPSPTRSPVTLALMLSGSSRSSEETADALDELAAGIEDRMLAVAARRAAASAAWHHPIQDALFEHDLAQMETERRWALDTARRLRG